jgi:DNA (cytosine-5)-methyltransferase 1
LQTVNYRDHVDLFSGIGGFALACRELGIATKCFCEKSHFKRLILENQFRRIPIFEEIESFQANKFRGSWLVTAGIPCTPFSRSGSKKGTSDDRFVWDATFKAFEEIKSDWILIENTPDFAKLALQKVSDDLEALGYQLESFCIPACAVGALHKRERIFIIANADDKNRRWKSLPAKPSGQSLPDFERDIERAIITGKRRSDYGFPDWVDRIASCGDAVVPQVAYEIIKAMIEADESA